LDEPSTDKILIPFKNPRYPGAHNPPTLDSGGLMAVILVTGGFDQKIKYWEATSGVCSRSIRFGESQINKLQISKDKMLIAAGGNPIIHLYDTTANHETPYHVLEGHTQNITDLSFQSDGKLLFSCSEDGTMKVWDVRTGQSEISIDTRCGLNSAVLHPNEIEIFTGDQNGCLKGWDLRTNTCRFEQNPLPEVPIRSLSLVYCPPLLPLLFVYLSLTHF
jgi:target of rapamycin complex subunit LST8